MFNLEKAIERNKLRRLRSSMAREELIALPQCDGKCPPWRKEGCCVGCNIGFYSVEERKALPESVIKIMDNPKGASGPDGCKINRELRPLGCLSFICNPFMRVAGVNNG